ncbi:MAG: TIGR04211 family SH3 domain-containing protein [Shewanella sp.]
MLLLSPNLLAEGQSRYISDDVFLYLLNGPSTDYRILGSIEAGQPVTLLGETQGDFSKIVDHKGREGWVASNLVVENPSFRAQVPALTDEIAQLKAQLTQALNSTGNNGSELADVKSQLNELQNTLKQTTQERDNLKALAERNEADARYELWRQGGMIAGIGALIGMLLVYLPRPQRRNKKRWM